MNCMVNVVLACVNLHLGQLSRSKSMWKGLNSCVVYGEGKQEKRATLVLFIIVLRRCRTHATVRMSASCI